MWTCNWTTLAEHFEVYCCDSIQTINGFNALQSQRPSIHNSDTLHAVKIDFERLQLMDVVSVSILVFESIDALTYKNTISSMVELPSPDTYRVKWLVTSMLFAEHRHLVRSLAYFNLMKFYFWVVSLDSTHCFYYSFTAQPYTHIREHIV